MGLLVMPYRVLLVDDAPAVREALRWALEDDPDLVIVGEAGDGAEALRRATDLQPDLVDRKSTRLNSSQVVVSNHRQ